jgi:hypothetical protein
VRLKIHETKGDPAGGPPWRKWLEKAAEFGLVTILRITFDGVFK